MRTLRNISKSKIRLTFLALLTVTALLMPASAMAAERDGTVLFFSLEDVQNLLTHPSLPAFASLFSFSQPISSLAWRAQSEATNPDGSLQRYAPYSNGLWADGYRLPGPHPLWGD